MADIGYILLVLALLASAYSGITFVLGARTRQRALVETGRNGLATAFGLLSLAVIILVNALLSHDFSLAYVVDYSSRSMPFVYLLTALWAGNTGSLLFWAWLLAAMSLLAVLRQWRRNPVLVPYAAAVMMATQVFFILLLVFAANPFEKVAVPPPDGWGLNPLLQNPGMIVHPPLLLGGYAILTIPFGFAVAALITGRLGDRWLTVVRSWTVVGWLLLGVGNVVGAWWAYVELGWGGYWAWDPVENAGLMPMLPLTAFLHSSIMQRRKGLFKTWGMALLAAAFNLCILGTFLTRSGVLSVGDLSVHSFPDTGMGLFFLAFLAITVLGSAGLIVYRRQSLQGEHAMETPVSREGSFLLTNVLLSAITFTILLGTVFPLLVIALGGRPIALGAEYYNKVASLPFLAVLLLIAVCAFIGWRRASWGRLGRDFLVPAFASLGAGVIMFALGIRQWYALVSLLVTIFVLVAVLKRWLSEVGARHRARGIGYLRSFGQLVAANGPRYGGYLVHVGIVVMVLGIIGSSFYITEQEEVPLAPGETVSINGYSLTYRGLSTEEKADRVINRADIDVYRDGSFIGTLEPEQNRHTGREEQRVTEVAIRSNLVEDLYVLLLGWNEDGTAFFTIQVSPLVNWIWIGGGLFLAGGVLALWPRGEPAPAVGRNRGKRRQLAGRVS